MTLVRSLYNSIYQYLNCFPVWNTHDISAFSLQFYIPVYEWLSYTFTDINLLRANHGSCVEQKRSVLDNSDTGNVGLCYARGMDICPILCLCLCSLALVEALRQVEPPSKMFYLMPKRFKIPEVDSELNKQGV
jgi:hypothetical protein